MGFSLSKTLGGGGSIISNMLDPLHLILKPGQPGAPNLPPAPKLNAPNLPNYPGMTPEEQQNNQARLQNANQFNGLVGQQGKQNQQTQGLYQGLSGLYDANGQVNQQAVQQLQQQIAQFQQQQQSLNNQGVSQLQGLSGNGANPATSNNPNDQINNQIYSAEQQRYLNALSGTAPVSVGLQQQKAQDWQKTKQQAALNGIKLSGDTPESAASQSTAGNQLITDFNKRYGYLQDLEKRGDINYGGNQNISRMGLNANIQNQQYNQAQGLRGNMSDIYGPQTGFADTAASYGPAATAGLYGQADQLLASSASPYQQQSLGQFGVNTNQAVANSDIQNQNLMNAYQAAAGQALTNYNSGLANYNANQAQSQALLGLVGTGIGAYFGGPMGAAAGSQITKGVNPQGPSPVPNPYTNLNLYNPNSYRSYVQSIPA